ncbi:MAG: hypothetical protein NTV46_08600 [Verrucomicrobia bacterium]|nr:hypothetical protein [Verrucomicrobiota bacterium]
MAKPKKKLSTSSCASSPATALIVRLCSTDNFTEQAAWRGM